MQKKDGHGQAQKKKTMTTTAALPDLEALATVLRSDSENIHRYTISQDVESVQQRSRAIREHSLPIFPRAKQWDARLLCTQPNTIVHATDCGSLGPVIECALLPLHLQMSSATARGTFSFPMVLSRLAASIVVVLS